MKRVLVGFWLSLCILLLGGYSQLYAHTPGPGIFGTIQNSYVPLIRLGVPNTEKGHHSVDAPAIEEEDDQFNSFKKYLQSRCQFAAIFYAQALKDFLHDSVKSSRVSEPPPYFVAERWYLRFEVFRV